MTIAALVLLPLLAGLAAFGPLPAAARRALLVGAALGHTALTALAWALGPAEALGGWLGLDALALLFLTITSVLFLAGAVYATAYLRREAGIVHLDMEEGFGFTNEPEAVFVGSLLLFLGTMTLVLTSRHFGLLWVAMEATTLTTAPLIFFHRHHRSLEATWKYLVVCSVGIALALLGNFFLGVAGARAGVEGKPVPLWVDALTGAAPQLETAWLRAGFILLLVGYGTKMGLAPMHTWLPDAHSEAPSVVSALLSGALLNCAFFGILRAYQVCVAAGQGPFARDLLVTLGLASVAVAAVFVLGQTDYKRVLAYSSVEHMGLLALGVGVAGVGPFGALWHALNHALTKAALFLVAGNILTVYRTKAVGRVRGVIAVLPVSGTVWLAGFLALTGSPPFAVFFSKLTILQAAFAGTCPWVGPVCLGLLVVAFTGMATVFLRTAQGDPPREVSEARFTHRNLAEIPPVLLAVAVLGLGLWMPPGLRDLLVKAARILGGV
jgi:hydrogenase-4 component F